MTEHLIITIDPASDGVRICRRCGNAKTLEEFVKDKKNSAGRSFICLVCKRQHSKEYSDKNKEKIAAKYIKWVASNRDTMRARAARYYRNNKKKHMACVASRPQEKRRASSALREAVKSGKICRPKVCSCCGGGGRIDGHHEDYGKPLSVEWLCSICHADRHNPIHAKVEAEHGQMSSLR